MKRLCAAWMLLICLIGRSQTVLPSLLLSITFQKTTNLIFPYRIEKADIGSGDVIGHKDAILDNVLFLKANRKYFAPTNLSVYTSDGKFYSFIVRYTEDPDTLNLSFANFQKSEPVSVDAFKDARLDSDATQILQQPSFLHRKTKSQEMTCILNGIYLKDHLIWFRIGIKNRSGIDYQTDYVKFCVRDKKTGNRTAMQESVITSAWRSQSIDVPGNGYKPYVFAFAAFTIAKQKQLVIQMEEKMGGRTLTLPVRSKILLKARSY